MLRKTTIQIEVLDNPKQGLNPSEMELDAVVYGMTYGNFSGVSKVTKTETLSIDESIKECENQGSDADFFEIPDGITQKEVETYLEEIGIKVREDEPDHYVELMMDNHKCVQYNGVQYYIPEENNFGTDDQIFDLLVTFYHV